MFKFLTRMAVALLLAAPAYADEALDRQIERYLMENPEALAAALDNMQMHFRNKEMAVVEETLAEKADALYRNPADYTIGAPNAPITIVEFFDYNCGFCKRAFDPLMRVVRANADVRLVFKEYPILSESSRHAARTALAIGDTMDFLTFHSRLMSARGALSPARITEIVKELDLGSPKGRTDDEIDAHLAATAALARDLRIDGTPAFIINGEIYRGALSEEEFADVIEKAREAL